MVAALEEVFREEWGRVLATLIGVLGDFDLAEDAAQEAFDGRDELAAEAIWLGRALTELLPDDPEVRGLLAMMLLHDSRRETRFSDGARVLLGDQNRSGWNTTQIAPWTRRARPGDRSGRSRALRRRATGRRSPHWPATSTALRSIPERRDTSS